ncbi:MAG TPA: hypothetical protein VMR86_00350 [Myxococcota bacterium]|nr:hypothetical protein [Myxococcota bacterium]
MTQKASPRADHLAVQRWTRYGFPVVGVDVALVGRAQGLELVSADPAIAEADLTPVSFEEGDYAIDQEGLRFQSGERELDTLQTPWRPDFTDQELARAVTSGTLVTVWLYHDRTEIFGLEAGGLSIPRSRFLEDYLAERRRVFWLIDAVPLFGAGTVAAGIWLRRSESARSEDG